MRITNQGDYRFCRWMNEFKPGPTANIRDVGPLEYFQKHMAQVRDQMFQDQMPEACVECENMERYGKISGRQRQLLKVGIQLSQFEKTYFSSPFLSEFDRVAHGTGTIDLTPQDWHIDLGNYCNSACVFCVPESSSRLATEYRKIGLINQLPAANWCDDPRLVDRFVDDLLRCENLQFLHFLGGETIITPAFETILQHLVDAGVHEHTRIGFTTNLTVWPEPVIELVKQFKEVHLNMSVECLDPLNDYVRYPSRIDVVQQNLDRWVALGKSLKWLMVMRVTPTVLTVHKVWSVYEYAVRNNLNVESCNFLHNPRFMRPTVLPEAIRLRIADDLESNVGQLLVTQDQILNIRHPDFAAQAALQDAKSYVQYLRQAPEEPELLPELKEFLQRLEQFRKNSIIDYLPEYESFLR